MVHRSWGAPRAIAAAVVIIAVACGSTQTTPPETGAAGADGGAAPGGEGGASSDAAAAAHGADAAAPVDAASIAAMPPDADHPWIRYSGRWDRSTPKTAVAMWGAVSITAAFEGTTCTARLVDEQLTVTDIPGTGNYYQVSVDGGAWTVLPSSALAETVLASGLPAGVHSVTLVRRTESKYGKTTFSGLKLDPGKHLAPPPAPPARKIEVFGDSITAGLADEDTGGWNNATENGYESFAPKLARLVGAEWHVEARGGGSFYDDTYLPMVPWFDKVFGPHEAENDPPAGAALWDFTRWQPDAFVLALGTNDFSDQYPHIDESLYLTKYQAFLRSLRGWYPSAEIFCLAPFKEGAPWDEARKYISDAVAQLGDAHVHAIDPLAGGTAATGYPQPWLDHPQDYVAGDDIHPNLAGDAKIAAKLRDVIASVMGW
jgi:lysophospholipase L1-like esterase